MPCVERNAAARPPCRPRVAVATSGIAQALSWRGYTSNATRQAMRPTRAQTLPRAQATETKSPQVTAPPTTLFGRPHSRMRSQNVRAMSLCRVCDQWWPAPPKPHHTRRHLAPEVAHACQPSFGHSQSQGYACRRGAETAPRVRSSAFCPPFMFALRLLRVRLRWREYPHDVPGQGR